MLCKMENVNHVVNGTFILCPHVLKNQPALLLDTGWLPAWLRALFQPLKLAHHISHRAAHLTLSHSCEDPRPTPQGGWSSVFPEDTSSGNTSYKEETGQDIPSLSLIEGDDDVQTCGTSNMTLTGTGCRVSPGSAP